MRFLNCPRNEELLEFVSIAQELSARRRLGFRMHMKICSGCRRKAEQLSQRWEAFFQPEPDITSSLMQVYSRLQSDETLVLKGWKLNDPRLLSGRWRAPAVQTYRRWVVSGGVVSAAAAMLAVVLWMPGRNDGRSDLSNASAQVSLPRNSPVPFAQIRTQDRNRVEVHYVQPELLQTIEFETTNGK